MYDDRHGIHYLTLPNPLAGVYTVIHPRPLRRICEMALRHVVHRIRKTRIAEQVVDALQNVAGVQVVAFGAGFKPYGSVNPLGSVGKLVIDTLIECACILEGKP